VRRRTTVQDAPELETYRQRTPRSAALDREARAYLPGGNSRSTIHYDPYPLYVERAEGCWLDDVDGNRLLDLTGNHTVLIHGNQHPAVLAAVQRQLALGTSFPQPSPLQPRLARQLQTHLPSLERVRFTNTGTEATMNAVRAARAWTGRPVIAKMEGGYHGSQAEMLVSTHPSAAEAGPPERPRPVPRCQGLPERILDQVLVLPFNDLDATAALLREQASRVAGVIVEPVLGSAGMIPAMPEYLAGLRELTAALGMVLIFDEVISFRVAPGGAQGLHGLRPDLTCLGKMIGGGLPLGVFGGAAPIMELFDPGRTAPPAIHHPGSFNANPLSLAAAIATLDLLTPEALATLNRRGEALRQGFREVAQRHQVALQVTGQASLFGLHLTRSPVTSYRQVMGTDPDRRLRLFLGLVNEGVLLDPRGAGCLSTAIGDAELALAAAALDRVLTRLD
jgi:glutamate-1-semialdehyde 2,1-aminomutase